MRKPRSLPVFFFCLTLSSASLLAQTKPSTAPTAVATASPNSPVTPAISAYPKTPTEFFARARQLSDLEACGIPFHLQATFVVGGRQPDSNGTYEEWWQSKNLWRKEATLRKFHYVAIQNGTGDEKVYTNAAYVPWHVTQVLGSIFFRPPTDTASAHWKMGRKKLHRMEFTKLTDKNRQYLFTEVGILRFQSRDDTQVIYNDFRSFQNMAVPCTIVIGNGDKSDLLTISIQSIEKLQTSQQTASAIMMIPHDLQLRSDAAPNVMNGANGVTPPVLTHQVNPEFPESVRNEHKNLDEDVAIAIIVDQNGNVQDAHIVQSAGSDLDSSALDAVRQYRFKPALFKGQAVPVKITVVVHFHIQF